MRERAAAQRLWREYFTAMPIYDLFLRALEDVEQGQEVQIMMSGVPEGVEDFDLFFEEFTALMIEDPRVVAVEERRGFRPGVGLMSASDAPNEFPVGSPFTFSVRVAPASWCCPCGYAELDGGLVCGHCGHPRPVV